MECYVCYEAEGAARAGCGCRGSTSRVHAACLVRYAVEAYAQTRCADAWSRCPACKQHYTGEALYALSKAHVYDAHRRGHTARYLEATLVLSHCVKERGDFAEAERLQRHVFRACRASPEHAEGTVLAADFLLETLLDRCHYAGDMEPALRLGRALHARRRRTAGAASPCSLLTSCNYAIALLYAGRTDEARALLDECVATLRSKHGETRLLRRARTALARCLLQRDERPELAFAELEAVLATEMRELGPAHPETLCTATELARAHADAGRPAAALPLYEQARVAHAEALPPDHPERLLTEANWASCLSDVGRHAEAEPVQRAVLRASRRVFGVRHANTAVAKANLRLTRRRLHQVRAGVAV
jgi:hypothetical protein